jgi:hypothetical protein
MMWDVDATRAVGHTALGVPHSFLRLLVNL